MTKLALHSLLGFSLRANYSLFGYELSSALKQTLFWQLVKEQEKKPKHSLS